MDLTELKDRLKGFDISEIKSTWRGFKRIQDKRRGINYPKVIFLLTSQEGLYRFEEQKPKNPENEIKLKLWFKLKYLHDMNIYIVINKKPREKGLNRMIVISAHKVKRKVQERIGKNEN